MRSPAYICISNTVVTEKKYRKETKRDNKGKKEGNNCREVGTYTEMSNARTVKIGMVHCWAVNDSVCVFCWSLI